MNRTAENHINYQERATEFAVGDVVAVYGESRDTSGRVLAVWPAIGMADVEFPSGTKRYPVEDLQRFVDGDATPPHTNSTPAGNQQAQTSGGSPAPAPDISRVAREYVKNALYWAKKDRKYRGNSVEISKGKYYCPKCRSRRGEEVVLKPATYKRRDGNSERLLGCPSCLFLVKKTDILNCPDNPSECEAGVAGEMAKDLNHEFDALVGGA